MKPTPLPSPVFPTRTTRPVRALLGLALALAAGSWPGLARAAEDPNRPKLMVGDPAPKLQNGRWIQGDPVKAFDKDHSYLVEFWATWCGPCRASIPHLDEIHRKFRDRGLVVIGQDVWEEDEALVEPFVKKMGEKMTYRVALDDKPGGGGSMATTWMAAANANGIPTAFLVDAKGVVAWIGHPMTLMDEQIESVLSGKFDVRAAAEAYRKENEQGWARSKAAKELGQAMKAGQWDEAEKRLDDLAKFLPEDQRDSLDFTRISIALGRGDEPGAFRLMGKLSDAKPDSSELQNALAWRLLTDPKIQKRDLPLAVRMADRAVKASDGKSAAALDTQARAYFMSGKAEEAVKIQQAAVQAAGDQDDQAGLKATLESYKQGKLPPATP